MKRSVTAAALALATAFCPPQAASANPQLVFPRDDGKHASAPAEDWRVSGDLRDAAGRRYAVTAVFYRAAHAGAPDVYSASFGVTGEPEKAMRSETRVERDGPGLASASAAGLDVRLGNWRLWTQSPTGSTTRAPALHLQASEPGISLNLEQQPLKPRAAFTPRDYAIARLQARGTLTIDGRSQAVTGLTWFEHEFGAGEEAAWNRFDIQFEDGRELMLRTKPDGTPLYGAVISANGATALLTAADFTAENTLSTSWMSTRTGVTYAALWNLVVPAEQIDLICQPAYQDQEVVPALGSAPFYSGLVDVERRPPPGGDRGAGFVELVRL